MNRFLYLSFMLDKEIDLIERYDHWVHGVWKTTNN